MDLRGRFANDQRMKVIYFVIASDRREHGNLDLVWDCFVASAPRNDYVMKKFTIAG